MKNRIKTNHPNGTEAVAPFIALSKEEKELYDGTGIMFAIVEGDNIVAIHKKPPVERKIVSRDEAIKNSGAKGWCKSARFEYERLVRDEQIRESELINLWHKSVVESGAELWRGVFSHTHFCGPQKQEYEEIEPPRIEAEEAEKIIETINYLKLIHTPLVEKLQPVDFDKRLTVEHYKKVAPLGMAIKNLKDFIKHTYDARMVEPAT